MNLRHEELLKAVDALCMLCKDLRRRVEERDPLLEQLEIDTVRALTSTIQVCIEDAG